MGDVLDYALVALSSCFLEDPARCAVGLLVAAGHLEWWLAFISLTVGGMAGDIGLYVIGRYSTSFLARRGWVDPGQLAWVESYFRQHAVKSVFFARFVPGARTVVFLAAGAARHPSIRFTSAVFAAAALQALIFLQISDFIADKFLPYLRDPRLRLTVFLLTLAGGLAGNLLFIRYRKRRHAMPIPARRQDLDQA